MLQYVRRLQVIFEQCKAQEEASLIAPKGREQASIDISRTRIGVIQMRSKDKFEKGESSDDAPKDVDWKSVRATQRYRKEQKENKRTGQKQGQKLEK